MFAHVRPAGAPTVLAQNSFNTRPVRSTVVPTAQSRKKMLQLAHSLKGKPYVWGATGPDRFDCSGFVYYVISNEVGPGHYREKEIKARTYKRILDAAGARIQDIFQARAGDIVFFPSNVNKGYRTDHIGFVIDPARGIFVTAQNPEIGVGLGSYAVGQYWASREPMIYRNIWVP